MRRKKHYHQSYQKEHVEKKLDTALLKRLLHYLRPYRAGLWITVCFVIFAKAIEAIVPVFIGKAAQQILQPHETLHNGSAILASIMQVSLFIGILLILSYLFDAGSVFLKNWIGQKALLRLRTEIFAHIQAMPLSFFDKQSIGRLMTRTIHDIEQIDQMLTESIVPLFGSLALFVSMFVGMFYVNWRLALIFAFFCIFIAWITLNFRKQQRDCFVMIRSIVAALNGFMQEYLMGSQTIKTYGLQKTESRHFEMLNEDYKVANQEVVHHFAFYMAGLDFIQNSLMITLFATLVLMAPVHEGFQATTYFTFSLYALMFFRPLTDLAERYNVLQSAMASAERVFDIMDRGIQQESREPPLHLEEIEEILFDQVWFAYEAENWILKGFSMQVKKGESIALVGVTGAGKSTIISLLLRFYDFQKGTIKVNGRDIRDYSLKSIREQFSLVLQDPVIFSGSIADNISLYEPHMDLNRLRTVIENTSLQELIKRFPKGMEHPLQERGTNLSVGEKQLISMARALAYDRPAFLFDEATANIDTRTESVIQNTLKEILGRKTAIVIAHRLSTIQNVTKVIVLHQGVAQETGSHQELLQLGGIYEKLYRLQFSD